MSNRRIWKTQYGEKIQIKNLDDEHLENIIRMIERNHRSEISAACSLSCMVSGEQASYDIESAISRMEAEGPSSTSDYYDDLVEELERRKERNAKRRT